MWITNAFLLLQLVEMQLSLSGVALREGRRGENKQVWSCKAVPPSSLCTDPNDIVQ